MLRFIRTLMPAALIAGLGWSVPYQTREGRGVPKMQNDSPATPANEELISQWLGIVLGVRAYEDISDLSTLPDGQAVRLDSERWADTFFTAAANPHRQKMSRMSVHRATKETLDIIRHEYSTGSTPLVVRETVNMILITVARPFPDLAARGEAEKRAAISGTAAAVLMMRGTYIAQNLEDAPYTWNFRFPALLKEGVRFSTDPAQDLHRIWSWAGRLDGGIDLEGRLYFIAYKMREATSGRVMIPDGQHWFDGQCWAVFDRPRDR
jgi:hypothetical protein